MYKNYDNDFGVGGHLALLVGAIILILVIQSCSVSSSRSLRNMEPIKEGYCYDVDTGVIYIESYSGRYGTETAYTAYYNENGEMCKYDLSSGQWIPIKNK